MEILKKLTGITLLLAVLLIAACGKDKDPGNSITPEPTKEHQCRLTKLISNSSIQNYIYNSSGQVIRIDHIYPSDTSFNWSYHYTYNAAGKAVEEIRITANNVIENKRKFFYDANNLLIRMEFYWASRGSGVNQLSEYFIFQYNSAGQRIRTQQFSGDQPNVSDEYLEFTYIQNGILAKGYNARTNPATLTYSFTTTFDNKKSPFHALGYLEPFPEVDKYNELSTIYDNGAGFGYGQDYVYNSLDYPIKAYSYQEMSSSECIFKYACH